MMVPPLASADPLASAPVVPFCGVLDVVRLLFRTEHSSAEVCEICRTVNLGAAPFCKCCGGKLPAYYATLGPENTAERLRGAHRIAGEVYAYALASVGLVIMLAAVYVALSHAQAPSRPARVSSVPPPWTVAMEPVTTGASRVAFTDPQAAASEPTAMAVPEDAIEPAAATPIVKPRPPRRTVPTRALKPASSRLAEAEASVAHCDSLSFPFARAVCMNNRCAQPALGRSAVCVDAVRQRRIDEARRNPTQLG